MDLLVIERHACSGMRFSLPLLSVIGGPLSMYLLFTDYIRRSIYRLFIDDGRLVSLCYVHSPFN